MSQIQKPQPDDDIAWGEIYDLHAELVDKKFLDGLTPEEQETLAELKAMINEQHKPYFDGIKENLAELKERQRASGRQETP